MSRGQPDFSQYATKAAGATLSDMADLAVRLGSIVEFDRRGDVIFIDDFENPTLGWVVGGSGAGFYGRLDTDDPYMGSQCVRLHTPDLADAYAVITKIIGVTASASLGFEVSFSGDIDVIDLICYMRYRNGTTHYTAQLKIAYAEKKIYYEDTDGNWAELVTISTIPSADRQYNTIKFVADFENAVYNRLLLNTQSFDISAYSIFSETGTSYSDLAIQIQAINRNATGDDIYIDNFVLTQNEP